MLAGFGLFETSLMVLTHGGAAFGIDWERFTMESWQVDVGEVERVRSKVERWLPDPDIRRSALALLAYAIEAADEERSDAWCLKETPRSLSVIAGRVYVLSVKPGALDISFVGPLTESLSKTLDIHPDDRGTWKKVPDGEWVRLPAAKASEAHELLRDAFDRFVDEVMARVRRAVDLEDHSPSALAFVAEEVGRDLPHPTRRAPEPTETDGDDIDDDTGARRPKVRGRAPIFEHGQRAIGSLVEDIDPARATIALPDLQRPFVWEDSKVRDLLDSLFIGFPVGTLVLWHTAEERDAKALGSARSDLRATTLVIDGQQRLTSLFAVMRGVTVEDKDGSKRRIIIAFRPRDGRFEVADAAIRQDPEFLSDVSELWNGPRSKFQIRRDLLALLKSRGRVIDDAYEEAVDQNLERAHSIKEYRFPTVDIRKTADSGDVSEEDVADIFVRINNQGKRLGQADFVLTLLSVFHGPLRDRIETRASEMSGNGVLGVDPQQVLRMACAVGFGRARMSAVYRYLRGIDPVSGDADPERRVERLDALDTAAAECVDSTTWRDFMLRVTHAGFVSSRLVASTNAVVNAYAFYILGRRAGVPKARLDEGVSRWLFSTLLTARYSSSSEGRFEEDLSRVRELGSSPDAFMTALDGVFVDSVAGDYWTRILTSALETQRHRAPSALAFRAAQVVLGARALFSDQLLQNFLNPPGKGKRAASELHHLFPKAWLTAHGVEDRRRVNQVANMADVSWHDNSTAGRSSPARYVPRIRENLKIDDDRWGRMCAEHALPLGWETMDYASFLEERRKRMADVIRIAFRKLGGEPDSLPLVPPWFLPGAEVVWQRIAEAELALKSTVRETYTTVYGDGARAKLEAALQDADRERLARSMRSLPSTADPLAIVDYLYLGQLPSLLFVNDVWSKTKSAFGGGDEFKPALRLAIEQIAPVRNEIAHVREVAPDRLQRANVACGDILRLLARRRVGGSPA